MGEIRKIHIAVAEESASAIDAAVASGEFATFDDVVAAALDAWKMERVLAEPENVLRLRRLWEEGITSGPPVDGNFDLNDIKRYSTETKNFS